MTKPITCGIFDSFTSSVIDSSTSYIDSESFFFSHKLQKKSNLFFFSFLQYGNIDSLKKNLKTKSDLSEIFFLENKYKLYIVLKSINQRNKILDNYQKTITENKNTFLNLKGDFVKILSSCDEFTYKLESEILFYISEKRKLEILISEYEEKIKLAS